MDLPENYNCVLVDLDHFWIHAVLGELRDEGIISFDEHVALVKDFVKESIQLCLGSKQEEIREVALNMILWLRSEGIDFEDSE